MVEERTTPKLRFEGFTDDWKQRKLGDLAKIVRGASPRPIKDPKWFLCRCQAHNTRKKEYTKDTPKG